MCFLVTTVSASLVSEAWMFASTKMLESSQNPSKKFLSCIDKEICSLFGKLFPSGEASFFGTVGTIFTYVLLFDDFNPKKQIVITSNNQ
ncbi:hypothetical protein CEXT_573921 [Caerostris extrusa]|uniref:Uncharacterized protein n=1 Tax=Caerostris extrusa TaxID=172846 RepID=A0AAV4TC89_CAEEX|nr:hypothetical protein CEXT_573921 [Caerostris extrusa]